MAQIVIVALSTRSEIASGQWSTGTRNESEVQAVCLPSFVIVP